MIYSVARWAREHIIPPRRQSGAPAGFVQKNLQTCDFSSLAVLSDCLFLSLIYRPEQ